MTGFADARKRAIASAGHETAAAAEIELLGGVVLWPHWGGTPYDFVVDAGGILSRVQVKGSTRFLADADGNPLVISFDVISKRREYKVGDIDFLVLHCAPTRTLYVVPWHEVAGSSRVTIRPQDDDCPFRHRAAAWWF